jgi:hypothetical protein
MTNVIDFVRERAIRKSGIVDKVAIDYMIDNGLDPCNSDDVAVYILQQQLIDALGDIEFDKISILPTTIKQDYVFCPDFALFFETPNK